jgi:hypothetical protein
MDADRKARIKAKVYARLEYIEDCWSRSHRHNEQPKPWYIQKREMSNDSDIMTARHELGLPDLKSNRAIRECLSCKRDYMSEWSGDRICFPCKH